MLPAGRVQAPTTPTPKCKLAWENGKILRTETVAWCMLRHPLTNAHHECLAPPVLGAMTARALRGRLPG